MWLIITALAVLVLDQASKYGIYYGFVVHQLGYQGAPYDLTALKAFLSSVSRMNCIPQNGNFLVISFTANDAALFGIGNGNEWAVRLLSALTAVFLALLIFFAIRTAKKQTKLDAIIFGLIIGGSIGNLYDRILLGFVRDMIYVKIIDFPIFNIADSAICIAIGLLIIETLFLKKDGVFELIEDDIRWLFHLKTRQEAEALEKERKKKRLSRFEEEIPDEEYKSQDGESKENKQE